jgi:hypothetical protein
MTPITVERTRSGSLLLTTTSADGLTFEARQSPLTQRVPIPGQYLHITGPLEHKRPQKAMYDLRHQVVCDWPDNRNTRRRERFNETAHRLIREAVMRSGTVACTGVTASWCPVHGDCGCDRHEDGEVDFASGEHSCPLHAWDSPHAEAQR